MSKICELQYHYVFCPKYRRKVLIPEVASRFEELVREKAEEKGWEILSLTVQPDHVHLFVKVKSSYHSPAYVINQIKGYTARNLRKEFPWLRSRLPCMWSRSYYVGSLGQVSAETVKRYIEAQKGK